jgi:Pyruvate/2-oxoacid:ferredoxin oxidoreductase gamma subunit
LKLARPELTVIVLMGDGGCGIGGTHLLNAARRNVDITLIVANNFNYGMTGGQHSVTTPSGAFTATTPAGNIETAMDLCATTIGAGATWAYRGLGFDNDLAERVVDGIHHPGFAMLDIWDLCTAYYLPRNNLNKRELYKMIERAGMKAGLLANSVRPSFEVAYRQQSPTGTGQKETVNIDPEFQHCIENQTGIVIAGSAGQKIRSAATVFASAGILSGLKATQKDDYPVTIMTGHSISEINLSPYLVQYTAIESPDYFLVISEDGLKKTASRIRQLPSTCKVMVDEGLDIPDTQAEVLRLPFLSAAREVGRLSIGIITLATLLAEEGLFSVEAFQEAIARYQAGPVAATNIAAVKKGVQLCQAG